MSGPDWKKPLILSAALVALGAGSYFLVFKQKPKNESKEEEAKKLLSLKETQVAQVQLVTGPKSVSFSCSDLANKTCKPGDNSKWQLGSPLKAKADDANVNSLISTINNFNVTETLPLKEETPEKRSQLLTEFSLSESNLGSPTARKLIVETPSGLTVIYLGGTHPIGESIYAGVEKLQAGQAPSNKPNFENVYLIPSYIQSNWEKDLTYWRDKKVSPIMANEINGFLVQGSKGTIRGERQGLKWNISSNTQIDPANSFSGDNEAIESLLSVMTYLTAKNFASEQKDSPDAKKMLSGKKKFLELTVWPKPSATNSKDSKEEKKAETSKNPISLAFWSRPGLKKAKPDKGKTQEKVEKIYLTVSTQDPLYEVESTSVERLEKDLKSLRLSKILGSLERFSTKKIEISGGQIGSPGLVLNIKEGKWTAEGFDLDSEKIQTLLDRLTSTKAKDFLTGSTYPAGEGDGIQIKALDEKGAALLHWGFWKKGESVFARDLLSKRKEALLFDVMLRDVLPWSREGIQKQKTPEASKTKPVDPISGKAGS